MACGDIEGVREGAVFADRQELHAAGVHDNIRGGIHGRPNEQGAESIVLSQGYEDDIDLGYEIFYTGEGGRGDSKSKNQIKDQKFTGRNLTLAENVATGVPVRVIRRVPNGYRYDGLYSVVGAWLDKGKSGFEICRFRLIRAFGRDSFVPSHTSETVTPADRRESTVYRVVRNSALSEKVKRLHDFRCQICTVRLETQFGPYAEGAHILPLGQGHGGPDVLENLLCLCPNDHVQFDYGALFVLDDLVVEDREGRRVGKLRMVPEHSINPQYLRKRREIFRRQ